jgi:hypothetical protein
VAALDEARSSLVLIDGKKHVAGSWLALSALIILGPPLSATLIIEACEATAESGLPAGNNGWLMPSFWLTGELHTQVWSAILIGSQLALAAIVWRTREARPWSLALGSLPFGVLANACWGNGWHSCDGERAFFLAAYGVLFAAALMRFLVPYARAWRVKLALDRDGLRLCIDGHGSYWPFELLGRASIQPAGRSPPELAVWSRDGRRIAALPLLDGAALARARRLAETLSERTAETLAAPELPALLPRRRREPLGDWLAKLDGVARSVSAESGYRGGAIDPQALLALVREQRVPVDARAAATYVLLRRDVRMPPETAARLIDAASAPLVTVLAALARPDLAGKRRSALEAALAFLDTDERLEYSQAACQSVRIPGLGSARAR